MKQKCPYTNLKNKMKGYINFILRPKRDEFGGIPVCPFAGPELDQDKLLIDVFNPDEESFIDKMQEFEDSKYSSALFAQIGAEVIPESDTRKYQAFLNKLIKRNGFTEYKIICFNPEDSITNINGFNPRQFAPTFLINVAGRKELGKAHKIIMKSKYFDKMSEAYKKYLNV